MENDDKKERLNLTARPEIVRMLDEWRREQDDLPSRSEAIRRMIVFTWNASGTMK
jgi:metal-responsive CopG/Arc/MetJ family transcriptional regulator